MEAELTSLLGTVLRRGGSNVANTWTSGPAGASAATNDPQEAMQKASWAMNCRNGPGLGSVSPGLR